MKKKRLIFMGLTTCLLVYGLGSQVLSAGKTEDELIDELFDDETVYPEVAEKYGVNGFGVSKSEKELKVMTDDPATNEEVKQYFDEKLELVGVNGYEVVVFSN